MSKRGQASVFIILGIIVLALFGTLLYFKGDLLENVFDTETEERFTSPDIEPVKDVVQGCVEVTLLDAVEWVSNRGGYFDPFNSSSASRDGAGVLVAYSWHFDHGTRIPSLYGLGVQLNNYMADNRENITDCIDTNIGSYERSWNIQNIDEFVLDVPQVTENYIKQRISYPQDSLLSITKDDYAATASEIVAELEIALGQAQRLGAEISSCFNGDYIGLPTDYNTFCNVGGIPFRAELYNMRYHNNIVRMLHQDCNPDCDDCYILKLPSPAGEDILFNVALRTC